MRILTISLLLFLSTLLRADEGMWLPLLLNSLNETEMQSMGMKMTADDIYSVNHGSLKDAIVSFGGFCTGEIISTKGLILTNHHCGYGAIQRHSTVENNLLANGFWAMSREEELPTPGLFVTFIIRIEDVTKAALEGISDDMTPAEKESRVAKNINSLSDATPRESYQSVSVRPFYEGNQFYLFVTETYRDVRLVGAPPESIGKFGADTDNWEWPRHNADFSMFRVYAGPDNTPADYSPDNVPLSPRYSLPVSLAGVKEDDFTLILGFPGRTDEYLTSYGLRQLVNVTTPAAIGIRSISLGIMDREMRKDEATRLRYAPRYSSLSNSYKKWIGQLGGLKRVEAEKKKEEFEHEFVKRIRKDRVRVEKYGHLIPDFEHNYALISPLEQARLYYSETFGVNIRVFQLISRLDQLRNAYVNNGAEGYANMLTRLRPWFAEFFRDNDQAIDREICQALLTHMSSSLDDKYLPDQLKKEWMRMHGTSLAQLVNDIYSDAISSEANLNTWIGDDAEAYIKALSVIPAYQFFVSVQLKTDAEISPEFNTLSKSIAALQSQWMAAIMDVFPEKRFWPDANSTMRVAYGKIEGYSPRDGVEYTYMTFLDGVMEKYKPGDYEFDVDPKLIALYEAGDYGRYADRETGKLPVCIIGSNHTTGGNSGSPAIDASGNLIGLNFDRTWESTMSDYYYDVNICRNIMVDIRYVLFIIDKFAGAEHLIKEMQIVNAGS